jgi:hypothetical protein
MRFGLISPIHNALVKRGGECAGRQFRWSGLSVQPGKQQPSKAKSLLKTPELQRKNQIATAYSSIYDISN